MNEAHSDLHRCVRTREVGRALLPAAHRLGVRHLALEALSDGAVTERANAGRALEDGLAGYLGQPEMRALVNEALALGWTLHSYEADFRLSPHGDGPEDGVAINWREDQQARNLGAVVAGLPASARVICWCGNGHLYGRAAAISGEPLPWTPMGSLVARYCGVEPFAIDQTITVAFDGRERDWAAPFSQELRVRGGTAGFLSTDIPEPVAWLGDGVGAYLLSLDNAMTGDAATAS